MRQWNAGEEQPESVPEALKTFPWMGILWSEEEVSGSDEPALLVNTYRPSDFDVSLEGDSVELTSHEQDSSSYCLKPLSDEVQRMGHEGSIVDQSSSLRERSLELESTIPNFQESCSELELKLQLLQATSYNGELIWKIPELTRRTAEAKICKIISLYSSPFYTRQFGYKMCRRMYLNGDDSGKDTHLSLFDIIMKGEYDALLSWPFRQLGTLTLLDQDMRKNIVQAFRPVPFPSFLAVMRGEYDALLSWPFQQMVTIMIPPNQEKRK